LSKHKIISDIESENHVIFSEINLGLLRHDDEQMKKLERIYFQLEFVSGFYEYIIYKGPIPFYLSLERVDDTNYQTTCYCETKNYDKVKIFLNTLLKKQKNANDNLTGTQNKN
jgi:hypothetical protein